MCVPTMMKTLEAVASVRKPSRTKIASSAPRRLACSRAVALGSSMAVFIYGFAQRSSLTVIQVIDGFGRTTSAGRAMAMTLCREISGSPWNRSATPRVT